MDQKLSDEEIDNIISNYTEYIGDSWNGDWGISSGNIRKFVKEIILEELKLHNLTNSTHG